MPDDREVLALAVDRGELFVYRGPNTTEYPVRFDGVTTDGTFRVDNPVHRLTTEMNGTQYFVRDADTDDAALLEEMIDDLEGERDTDDILATIDEYIERTEGDDDG